VGGKFTFQIPISGKGGTGGMSKEGTVPLGQLG